MKILTALLLSALVALAHGNGWCNQPAFQKYSLSSPLLFSCDDSDLKTEIASLRDNISSLQEQIQTCNGQTDQLLTKIQELQQTCNATALFMDILQLLQEIRDQRDNTESPESVGSFSNPASDCSEIFYQGINNTGTYWLNASSDIVNVTCDFDLQLPPFNPVRGWQEIANINLSDPIDSCPSPWREVTSPSRRCEKTSDDGGCESVFFTTNGVPFSRLCGRAIGYTNGWPDAFFTVFGVCGSSVCDSINDPYVEGISITYTSDSIREHIWSLAAQHRGSSRCPCGDRGFTAPSFVGDNYYCETAVDDNSPLWDGIGCTDGDAGDGPCCDNPNFPWFCREFDQPIVTDNIEVRICTDESRNNEDIDFDLLKLYIR